MKRIFSYILFFFVLQLSYGQTDLTGAYLKEKNGESNLWLFVDGYASLTSYAPNKYTSTLGGPYTYDGESIVVSVEYNDVESESVGQAKTYEITVDDGNLSESTGDTWRKLPAKPQNLDGLWRITGRQSGNQMNEINRGDRKTIKILVDGYFQWIAINPAEKGFYGTGGGKYTFSNGKYAEDIIFFSRDNSRVGAKLTFDGAIENEKWIHSGKSSKGDDIREIWSRDRE